MNSELSDSHVVDLAKYIQDASKGKRKSLRTRIYWRAFFLGKGT